VKTKSLRVLLIIGLVICVVGTGYSVIAFAAVAAFFGAGPGYSEARADWALTIWMTRFAFGLAGTLFFALLLVRTRRRKLQSTAKVELQETE
jgi:hypothetical protein